jgi:hypothetical protein
MAISRHSLAPVVAEHLSRGHLNATYDSAGR